MAAQLNSDSTQAGVFPVRLRLRAAPLVVVVEVVDE
jgi:hypothetical protein